MNNVIKHKISDNMNLYVIKDVKYKTVHCCTHLYRPLSREEATFNALLSKVLKCGTNKYSSMNELNVYAEELYGCIYDVSVSKKANLHSIVSSVNVIADKYTGECSQEKAIELMLDLIFKPYLPDGVFSGGYVETQKINLADDIDSLINDKRSYANVRCIEEMCKNEPNSIVEIGYKEDFDTINETNLFEHYQKIVFTSPVDIFVVGDVDDEKILMFLRSYFSSFKFDISPIIIELGNKLSDETKYVEDNLNVNQGKLALGLRTGINIENPLYYALLVGNSILGSGAHSKLFNNVREKLSLCYYAYSRLDKYNGLMLIGSGIEFENFEKTKNAICEEIENVKCGKFTDEELEIAKEYIISSYRSYEDSPGLLIDYYISLTYTPYLKSLEEASECISRITKDDVLKAFEKVSLDTVYFLNGKEGQK
ncbi:MAG: insulinase family protein [Clostridia bacterium]|nr:insulinase family protein [Clostridia bacterium]